MINENIENNKKNMFNLKDINKDNIIEEDIVDDNDDDNDNDNTKDNNNNMENSKLKYNEMIKFIKERDDNKYHNKNEFFCNILLMPLNIDFSNKISILSLITYCYQENKKSNLIYNIARKFEKNEKYLNAVDPLFFFHVFFRAGYFLKMEKQYLYAKKYINKAMVIGSKKSKIQKVKIMMCDDEISEINRHLNNYIDRVNNKFYNDSYFNPGKCHDIKTTVDSILEGKNNIDINTSDYLYIINKKWLIKLKNFIQDYLNSIGKKNDYDFLDNSLNLPKFLNSYFDNKNNKTNETKEQEDLSAFPGPINNYEIIDFKDYWIDNINIDENYFIKKDLKLNVDYFLLNLNDWKFLKSFFESTNEILRKKNNLDLIRLKFILFDKRINEQNNNVDLLKLRYIQINKNSTLKRLKEKIINIANINLPNNQSQEEKEDSNISNNSIENPNSNKEIIFYIIKKERKELLIEMCFSFIYNIVAYESAYINKLELSDGITIDDFLLEYNKDKHILIIEIIEKGKHPFFDDLKIRMKNGYKCTICKKKINHINDKYNCEFCNFSLFCSKVCADKSIDHTKLDNKLIQIKQTKFNLPNLLSLNLDSLLNGRIRGRVGLKNLGNTCYINSSLQCLSNTEDLTKYFLSGEFSKEINSSNSSSKGEISKAYYDLINKMWKGTKQVLSPNDLRYAICKKEEQFANNEQQDSQEFLLCLLDNLHDDLNRVTNKQYKELKEKQNNESIDEASNRFWEYHKSRENSIIVDLFHGQYKSSIKCLTCGNESITFDTYMNLQLPLPTKKMQDQIKLLLSNGTSIKLSIKLNENTEIKDIIKKALLYLDYKKYLDYLTSNKIKDKIYNYNNKDVPQDLLYNNIIVAEFSNDLKLTNIYNTSYQNINDTNDIFNNNKDNNNENNDNNDNNNSINIDENKKGNKKKKKKTINKDNNNSDNVPISFDKEKIENVYENNKNREIVLFEKNINSNDKNNIDIFVYPVTEISCKGVIGSTSKTRKLSYPIIITLNKNDELTELYSVINKKMSKFLIKSQIDTNSILIGFPHFSEKWINYKISTKKCPICDEKYNKNIKYCLLSKHFCDEDKILDIIKKMGEDRPLILFAESQIYNTNLEIYKGIQLKKSSTKKESELTIYDSLELFNKEEILDGEEKWYCAKCSKSQKAKKKMEIYRTPDYLIVQLKRFKQRGALMRNILGSKNETLIDYKEILNLSDFVVGPDKEKSIYLLYGVVIHRALLNGGHYYSFCKNNGDWLFYNDSDVGYCKNPINKDAYLLFYKRRNIV